MKTANEIRRSFLEFFHAQGHAVVPSSSLVPYQDPSLLFTNAGMVQFKDIFLGKEQAPYRCAASSQRCIRAGGKHNDLENVGYTYRHHTFFEMLGNFSFGDYFKREAIVYAWQYITELLGLDKERLWVTVFEEDNEAAEVWLKEIGINRERFVRIGTQDNFWAMGDVGPCGPCTEIFFDHGPSVAGGPPGSAQQEGDRYVELWNLVFMQYERDAAGNLSPLPKPSVDTGMGLERIAAVMQGVHDNYQTDLFKPLIEGIAKIIAVDSLEDSSLKVIADHLRSSSFLIVDGVVPSNEGRGYVLRRIIRRALRHGNKLGGREAFFYRLVPRLIDSMGEAYPDLAKQQTQIERVLKNEEERFSETLTTGLAILEQHLATLSSNMLRGDIVFKLYDTYGFPVDLTQDIAREKGLTVDLAGFEQLMEQQKEQAKQASAFVASGADVLDIAVAENTFSGYQKTSEPRAQVKEIFCDTRKVSALQTGEEGIVLLDDTPFYAESGGQVGDSGELKSSHCVFEVSDTQKQGAHHKHIGVVRYGVLKVGDTVAATIHRARRQAIVLNHSATHLLHAALKQILGSGVMQKGSLVTNTHLRFDFSHHAALNDEQIQQLEQIVNQQIRLNSEVVAKVMPKDQALKQGAVALFGEKYGEQVRVLAMGDFSTELCGGTHVSRTGDIGLFKILSESGVAAGVRRIEAVTGEAALAQVQQEQAYMMEACQLLKTPEAKLAEKIEQLLQTNKQMQKELEQSTTRISNSGQLASQAVEIEGVHVLASTVSHANMKTMRTMIDQLKNQLGTAAVVLASVKNGKVMLVAGVSKNCMERISASKLVNTVALQVGGQGGGRDDLAEAGGKNPAALEQALAAVPDWVRTQLSS